LKNIMICMHLCVVYWLVLLARSDFSLNDFSLTDTIGLSEHINISGTVYLQLHAVVSPRTLIGMWQLVSMCLLHVEL